MTSLYQFRVKILLLANSSDCCEKDGRGEEGKKGIHLHTGGNGCEVSAGTTKTDKRRVMDHAVPVRNLATDPSVDEQDRRRRMIGGTGSPQTIHRCHFNRVSG